MAEIGTQQKTGSGRPGAVLRRLLPLAAFFCILATGQAAAQCLSQAQARQVVAGGQARPLGSLKGQLGGEIVKAQLCKQGGGYVYRVTVLVNGKVQTKVINAGR